MKRTKHIYKRFFSLAIGQSFFIRRGKLAVKDGFASYREHAVEAKTTEEWGKRTPKEMIAPWRKVRTLIPVTTTGRLVTNHNIPSRKAEELFSRNVHCATTGPAMGTYINGKYVECVTGHGLRDPLDQDHTPSPPPENERTL